MFSRLSIQNKILTIVLSLFIFSAITTVLISKKSLYRITDGNQSNVYGQQVGLIIARLEESHDRLLDTLMPKAYKKNFQEGIVDKLRQTYYSGSHLKAYPFIINESGIIVLHPSLESGSASLSSTNFVQKILKKKDGEINYTFLDGQKKWTVFKEFKPWKWIVCYTMPIDLKYQAAYELEKAVFLVMVCVSGLAMIILFFFIKYLMKPIVEMTYSSQEIAQGNFELSFSTTRQDELGILARNFEIMRMAIKTQLSELEENKIHLEDLVKKRTEDLLQVNNDLKNMNDQLRQAQQQVLQSEKMAAIGQLSAGVAHEIKNPLAIILLSIESMEGQMDKLDDLTKRFIKMVKDAADRANKVVVELLNFSRFSDVDFKEMFLYKVINSALALVENHAKMKNIKFKTEYLCDKNVMLNGGHVLLQQVFFNLFINAVDASHRDAEIITRIYLEQNAGNNHKRVVVMISDHGCGIAPDKLKKIFEPFYTTKEFGRGTGLGLSTVYSIVERHQGVVDVRSEAGKGTVFFVKFPILEKRVER